jgi:hypothetical protein
MGFEAVLEVADPSVLLIRPLKQRIIVRLRTFGLGDSGGANAERYKPLDRHNRYE